MIKSSLKSRLFGSSGLREDERGIAAMEFALIAPLIIGVYLGLAELAMVLGVERQVSHSASVAGDLATQVTQLTRTDTADMMSAVLRVANVTDTNSYVIHIESFERDGSGAVQSLGSVSYNNGQAGLLERFDPSSLGTDMLTADSGVVVARVAYNYRPFGFQGTTSQENYGRSLLPTTVTLNETFLLKPRRSATVRIGTTPGTTFNCRGSARSVNCS